MLKRLEDKGFVQRSEFGSRLPLQPGGLRNRGQEIGLSDIVKTFFNGSPANAASALLGMSGKLKEDELDELEQMIARARQAKGGK